MKVLFEKNLTLKLIETKSGAKLLMLEEEPNHFWLEQNPLKDSKYWVAYRLLKKQYPDLYMFWELKDGQFTWNIKLEVITDKKWIDKLITDVLHSSDYASYEDYQENELKS